MQKGGWAAIPAALLLLFNYSIAESRYQFFLSLLYFLFFILLFFFLRHFNLNTILPPVIFFSSLIIFLYGFIQKWILFPLYLDQSLNQDSFYAQAVIARIKSGRIFALFALPTLYALVCSLLLIFILHYFLMSKKKIKFFWFLLLVLGIGNLLLTQSFGGLIDFSLAILFYLFVSRTVKPVLLAPIVMTLSLLFFIVVGLRYHEARALQPVTLRLSNWNQAGRVIATAPLTGIGLGNYETEVSKYFEPGEASSIYAHNFLLQWVAETGIPIFLLFGILLLPTLIQNWKKILAQENALFSSGLLLLVVYNLVDIGNYFFVAGLATAVLLSQLFRNENRKFKMKLTLLLLTGILLFLNSTAENHQKQADYMLSQKEKNEAKTQYLKSLAINPFSFRTLTPLASIYLSEKELDRALEVLQQAEKSHPQYSPANYLHSRILLQKSQYFTSFYYAEIAYRHAPANDEYKKWYELVKTRLQNSIH